MTNLSWDLLYDPLDLNVRGCEEQIRTVKLKVSKNWTIIRLSFMGSCEVQNWNKFYLDDPTDGEGEEGEVRDSPPSWPISLVCLLQWKQFNKAHAKIVMQNYKLVKSAVFT